MEKITIDITVDKIKQILGTQLDEVIKSSYSNPIRDIVAQSIKGQEGPIKLIIDSIITDAVSDPDFRKKMSDMVIQRMVESALKK